MAMGSSTFPRVYLPICHSMNETLKQCDQIGQNFATLCRIQIFFKLNLVTSKKDFGLLVRAFTKTYEECSNTLLLSKY